MADKNYLNALDVADRLEAITPAPRAGCARWSTLMVALTDLRATPNLSDDAIRSVLKILRDTRGGARWAEGLDNLIIDLTKKEAKQKEYEDLLNDDPTDIRKVAIGAEVQIDGWEKAQRVVRFHTDRGRLVSFSTNLRSSFTPTDWRRKKGRVVNFPPIEVVKAFLDLKTGDKVDLGLKYRDGYTVVATHHACPFVKRAALTGGFRYFSVYQYAQALTERSKNAEDQIEPARTPDATIRTEAFEQDFDSINPGDTVMTTKDFAGPSRWQVNKAYTVESRQTNVLRTTTGRAINRRAFERLGGIIVARAGHKETPNASESKPDMPAALRAQSEFPQGSVFMSLDVGSKITMEDGKRLLVVKGINDALPACKEGRIVTCAGFDGTGPWVVSWSLWLSNYGRKITEAQEQPVQMGAQPPISLEGAIVYGADLVRPTTLLPTYKDVWSFIDRMARAEPQEPSTKLKAFRFQMRALLREHITSDEALSPLHAVVLTEVATYYLNEHRSWIKEEGRCCDQGNRLLGFYASGLIAALEAIPDQGKISTYHLGLSINYLDKLYEAEQIKPEDL